MNDVEKAIDFLKRNGINVPSDADGDNIKERDIRPTPFPEWYELAEVS